MDWQEKMGDIRETADEAYRRRTQATQTPTREQRARGAEHMAGEWFTYASKALQLGLYWRESARTRTGDDRRTSLSEARAQVRVCRDAIATMQSFLAQAEAWRS